MWNQDKNAIIADSWYPPQNLGDQCDPWNWRRMWITAALGQAAANETIYSTVPEKELHQNCSFLLTDMLIVIDMHRRRYG